MILCSTQSMVAHTFLCVVEFMLTRKDWQMGLEQLWTAIEWTLIEDPYISGVSLTHGPAWSRQHIWIFAAALVEQIPHFNGIYNCPCTDINFPLSYQLPPL